MKYYIQVVDKRTARVHIIYEDIEANNDKEAQEVFKRYQKNWDENYRLYLFRVLAIGSGYQMEKEYY